MCVCECVCVACVHCDATRRYRNICISTQRWRWAIVVAFSFIRTYITLISVWVWNSIFMYIMPCDNKRNSLKERDTVLKACRRIKSQSCVVRFAMCQCQCVWVCLCLVRCVKVGIQCSSSTHSVCVCVCTVSAEPTGFRI